MKNFIIVTMDGLGDHKSDEHQALEAGFNHYPPQLECYVQALTGRMGLKS